MFKKDKKKKESKEEQTEEVNKETGETTKIDKSKETQVEPEPKEKKKPVKEDLATKAKRLSKEGLTTTEVGEALGINKYEASKLIKG